MASETSRRAVLGGAAAAGVTGLVSAVGRRSAGAATARRYEGKVVLISGGTSGIGAATARAFAAEGAKVTFCGRRRHLGQQVQDEIRAAGGETTYIRADVRQPQQVTYFVDRTVRIYGGLDVAVNNAGIQVSGLVEETTVAEWDDQIDTNVRGVFLCMQAEVRQMRRTGGGVIICTASSGAQMSRPNLSAYSASKRAVQGLIQSAALEYGQHGIRINALAPGMTDTPMVRPPGVPDPTWTEMLKVLGELNVPGVYRIARPEEMATATLALASDDFSYQTGTTIFVDGGLTAGRPIELPPGVELPS